MTPEPLKKALLTFRLPLQNSWCAIVFIYNFFCPCINTSKPIHFIPLYVIPLHTSTLLFTSIRLHVCTRLRLNLFTSVGVHVSVSLYMHVCNPYFHFSLFPYCHIFVCPHVRMSACPHVRTYVSSSRHVSKLSISCLTIKGHRLEVESSK